MFLDPASLLARARGVAGRPRSHVRHGAKNDRLSGYRTLKGILLFNFCTSDAEHNLSTSTVPKLIDFQATECKGNLATYFCTSDIVPDLVCYNLL